MLKHPEATEKQSQNQWAAIPGVRSRFLAIEEQMLGKLFTGYFNSKMAVLVFLIQTRRHKPDLEIVSGMCFFLDDLYHHILDDSKRERYRRLFLWFKHFLQKLPYVQDTQRGRAIYFVRFLYHVLGFRLGSNL